MGQLEHLLPLVCCAITPSRDHASSKRLAAARGRVRGGELQIAPRRLVRPNRILRLRPSRGATWRGLAQPTRTSAPKSARGPTPSPKGRDGTPGRAARGWRRPRARRHPPPEELSEGRAAGRREPPQKRPRRHDGLTFARTLTKVRGVTTPSSFPADRPITPALIQEHKISEGEYRTLEAALGRAPTYTELGVFSVMWSEHCSSRRASARPAHQGRGHQGPERTPAW